MAHPNNLIVKNARGGSAPAAPGVTTRVAQPVHLLTSREQKAVHAPTPLPLKKEK
jgi:hypothetical protein